MKRIACLLLTLSLVAAMGTSAFAHGGHGSRHHSRTTQYDICAVEKCAEIGLHAHDGQYYRCADYYDGCRCR